MSTKKRFSLTDLFCIAAMAVLLFAGILPAVEQSKERENRIQCAVNLKMMGLAFAMYSNNEVRNAQAFPRVHYDMKHPDETRFFTNWNQPNSFGEGAPESNDITAAFYLLFKTQDLEPKSLVCPDSNRKLLVFPDAKPKPANPIAANRHVISNFPDMEHISYSIQNMYPSVNAIQTGWKWNASIPPDFALLADLNPGGKAVATVTPASPADELSKANSPNHASAGQNVLYGDFHVEWHDTPFAGAEMPEKVQDNIYCRRAGVQGDPIIGPSQDRWDSVLLPTADYTPTPAKN